MDASRTRQQAATAEPPRAGRPVLRKPLTLLPDNERSLAFAYPDLIAVMALPPEPVT